MSLLHGDENHGLSLFDDKASAVGSFPTSMRGYERTSVDSYVRELEAKVRSANQYVRELQAELDEAKSKVVATDMTKLGAQAAQIIKAAEAQAAQLTKQAESEADRIKSEAQRAADETRDSGQREADDLLVAGHSSLSALRTQVDDRSKGIIDAARTESDSMLVGAQRKAEALRLESERNADLLREGARVEAEQIKQAATREAATIRQAVAVERERVLNDLRNQYDESAASLQKLLADATEHHTRSSDQLADEAQRAAAMRSEALAEIEEWKIRAARETEAQIDQAHRQADAMLKKLESDYADRKEQLKRETVVLTQRKQSIMMQLSNLSSLAAQSIDQFPDGDDSTGTIPAVADDSADVGQAEESTNQESTTDDTSTAVLPTTGENTITAQAASTGERQ